jgi:hypothetical protein
MAQMTANNSLYGLRLPLTMKEEFQRYCRQDLERSPQEVLRELISALIEKRLTITVPAVTQLKNNTLYEYEPIPEFMK